MGAWEHFCLELCFPTRPSIFLAPHQAIRRNTLNQKFPISFSVLKPAAQTGLHPLRKVHSGVSKSSSSHNGSLLQGLRYVVLSLHVIVQENMCMLQWITVKSGKAHVPREWPLHLSLREAEVYSLQSQFSIPGNSH